MSSFLFQIMPTNDQMLCWCALISMNTLSILLSQNHWFLSFLRCVYIYCCALYFNVRADALSETANRVDHLLYAGGNHARTKSVTTTPVLMCLNACMTTIHLLTWYTNSCTDVCSICSDHPI